MNENYPYFEINSFVLYIIIGLFGAYCINDYIKSKKKNVRGLLFFFIAYASLASFRSVDFALGGADALNYQEFFLSSINSLGEYESKDILFGRFTYLCRIITDSPFLYRIICYSIITYAYLLFIKEFSFYNSSSIPFLLLMIPYLKSFNTMRTSLAIAIFTIGIIFLFKKKTLLSIITILSTFFIHRMSILFILFLPYYYITKDININITKYKTLLGLVSYMVIGYLVSVMLQEYIKAANLLTGSDSYYLTMNSGKSFFESIVTVVPLCLILIVWYLCGNNLTNNNKVNYIKLLIFFDILIYPISFLLGMWRANEYLFIERIIFWSILIPSSEKFFKGNSKKIINYSYCILFFLWLGYRILREWEPCSIMPYKSILFE